MAKALEKTDLCQMSLTGMRGLFMLGLLIKAPRSFSEIREKFLMLKVMEPENSDDIIRIDMNTLRSIGCEISRSTAGTGYKYVLTKHPYGLHLESDEIAALKKAYKQIKEGADVSLLLQYHELFEKIASVVFDEKIKEDLLGISSLKSYNTFDLKTYMNDCRQNNTLELEYIDVQTNKTYEKTIVAEKIAMRSNKIYIFGHDVNNNNAVMLPIRRIKSVKSRNCKKENIVKSNPLVVRFLLKKFNASGLSSNEHIIESNKDGSQIIEGEYFNEFIALQRMLAFGSVCTVLEPQDIKNKLIDRLLAMREVYKND